MKNVVDKLMVVAHPDDEVLWGGANLLAEPGWKVLVATNVRNKMGYMKKGGKIDIRYKGGGIVQHD